MRCLPEEEEQVYNTGGFRDMYYVSFQTGGMHFCTETTGKEKEES